MEPGGKEAGGQPLTADEEILKRNTDCIYFLASPLTCKKGKDCEYRHSEGARVNPRDCWYWLNGSCLNPKCSFRHPPLNGIYGIPGPTLVSALPSQTVPTHQIPSIQAPTSNNSNKPPCFFFQKGQCLKGDRCPFMHGPQSTGPQPSATLPQLAAKVPAPVAEPPQTLKKESWDLKKSTHQNIAKVSLVRPVEKTGSTPHSGLTNKRKSPPHSLGFELSRSQPSNVPPVISVVSTSLLRSHHSQPADERHRNGSKETGELFGESSPRFDVLVDKGIVKSDYLHKEVDSNYNHLDYKPVIAFERDQSNGKDEYDANGQLRSRYGRVEWRSSSGKTGLIRSELSPDEMDRSDLRHRLLKQRRLNGSRSAISPDRRDGPYRRDDRYDEGDKHHVRHSRRDPISARLLGRIKLPVRSSPDRAVDLRSERERSMDRGRHRRLSPNRPADYLERNQIRMEQKSHDDMATDAKSFKSQHPIKDDPHALNFAGPKSLAELKGVNVSESSQEQSTKSISSFSLEGPKLKAIRESAPENGAIYRNLHENNHGDVGAIEDEEEEGLIPEVGEVSRSPVEEAVEMEEGMIVDTVGDREMENSDTRNEESDYEAAEVGDIRAEEDENVYLAADVGDVRAEEDENVYLDSEEELDDDDDEDDFATKVGIMFS